MGKSEIFKKLYFKQWVIGLVHGDIKDIIRTRTFNQDINWLPVNSNDHFYGDPFLLKTEEGSLNILFEDFTFDDNYGNISGMTLDNAFKPVNQKILLDTKSHLSYPFIFEENNKIYVFPEAARSGSLSCYEYDPGQQTLNFVQEVINLPFYDSTILKHSEKYWIFGTIYENRIDYKLYVFYSDNLFGPYTPHPANPVKNGLDGTRSAGNFIEVDGIIYRPTQNCKKEYGESITINKINILNEVKFEEEPYMTIRINKKNRDIHGIHTIHTINALDNLIAVDGMKWTFSLKNQWKNFLRNKRLLKEIRNTQKDKQIS